MICADTFEEKIDDMVEKKKEIASLTASSGEQWLGKMSDDELKDLFALSSAAEK
jgi:SNF2 family DNA or RNA helicase